MELNLRSTFEINGIWCTVHMDYSRNLTEGFFICVLCLIFIWSHFCHRFVLLATNRFLKQFSSFQTMGTNIYNIWFFTKSCFSPYGISLQSCIQFNYKLLYCHVMMSISISRWCSKSRITVCDGWAGVKRQNSEFLVWI